MRIPLSIFAVILAVALEAQLTIVIDEIPSNTPEGSDIFVAGNFQGWDPGDAAYRFTENGQGEYVLTFTPSENNMVFKFTRGSWATVEGGPGGGFLPDRTHAYSGGTETLNLQIQSWEDVGGTNSTASENVSILSNDFYMPQLDTYRRIWIYLPPDYDGGSAHYSVMYMHDGQNVFDQATSFSGEWEVDETLDQLHSEGDTGIIVVAIDNGGASRIDEYSPWVNTQYGGGDGGAYMDFIVNTLKPYIDMNYRTLPGREHTAIMGSSLGGLISHYAAVEYEETFSKVGVFSPSYWFADEAYTIVEDSEHLASMRIFILAGGQEGATMIPNAQEMVNTFLANDYDSSELNFQTDADGEHSEWYWRREFAEAYQWLFSETTNAIDFNELDAIQVFPNPTGNVVSISAHEGIAKENFILQITDLSGRVLIQGMKGESQLDMSQLAPGNYLLRAKHPKIKGFKVWTVVRPN